jgi:hypothetical protein
VTPELWIVAGPNGAGKTTLVSKEPVASLLPKVVFWNPDELARQILLERGFTGFATAPLDQLRSAFIEAADATFANLKNCISQGVPCGVETVLSTDKYKELVIWSFPRQEFSGWYTWGCGRQLLPASEWPDAFSNEVTMFRRRKSSLAGRVRSRTYPGLPLGHLNSGSSTTRPMIRMPPAT